jgi:enoyl-CoA hydratase
VQGIAARFAAGSPPALAATKRAVNAATLERLEPALQAELEGQSVLLASEDFAEAVVAFGEKRAPRFTGR